MCVYIYILNIEKNPDLKKKSDFLFKSDLFDFFNLIYRYLYIDVYIYKLFQTCSIQIDLGTCLNKGYLIFAYIKTLGNVHKASPPVVGIICLGKESMLCVCGCSSANCCLLISTCPGLCVLYGSPTRLQTGTVLNNCHQNCLT